MKGKFIYFSWAFDKMKVDFTTSWFFSSCVQYLKIIAQRLWRIDVIWSAASCVVVTFGIAAISTAILDILATINTKGDPT